MAFDLPIATIVETSAGGTTSGTVTSVASADSSITVANPTTTVDLAVVKSPALSISGQTGLLTFTGLTSTSRVKTIRDAADTILELGGSYTPTGNWTNMQLITPTIGVASATSVNKVAITAPATSATLTILNGKTLTANNSITLAGTDSTTMTFPSTTATIARTDAEQTFTGIQTFAQQVTTNNAITATANAATVPITSRISTVTNSSAATLTITITTTSAVDGMLVEVRVLDFSAVAQTITWVNTENSSVIAPTTSNGSTTLPLSVIFQFNSATTKWRCVGYA